MSRWGNSRELTRASYDLVKKNPGMNRWTVRAALYGALVGGAGVIVGMVVLGAGAVMLDSSDGSSAGIAGWVVVVLGGLVVVAAAILGLTMANIQLAGLVKTADDVLHGREPDQDAAREAAHSKFKTLAGWSAISVAVGTLVGLIRGDGDSGIIVGLVRALLAGLVATVWAVVTTLVLPVIVLEGLGVIPAIQRSAGIIRSTWGEALFGSVRIGARFMLILGLPGLVMLIGGIVLAIGVGGPVIAVGVLIAVVGVALVITGAVKAATCKNVFGVALYRWASGEGALGPFSEEDLRGAVRTTKESRLKV